MPVWTRFVLIGLILMCAINCGSSSTTTTTPSQPTPSGSTVSIVSGATTLTTNAFSPNPIAVARGATVTWVNNDSVVHTSTSDNNVWNSGTLAAGASFSTTFQTAGTFPYHCTFHRGMVGTVTVQ